MKAFNPKYLDTIVLKNENHFIPWTKFDLVKKELLKMIKGEE